MFAITTELKEIREYIETSNPPGGLQTWVIAGIVILIALLVTGLAFLIRNRYRAHHIAVPDHAEPLKGVISSNKPEVLQSEFKEQPPVETPPEEPANPQ